MGQMALGIGRREFIAALGSVVFQWPLTARAQQPAKPRLIVGLFPGFASAELQSNNVIAMIDRLRELGWIEGQNFKLEARYSGGDQSAMRANARELVGLNPDALLAVTESAMSAAWAETRIIPTVFLSVNDPVAAGYVESLAHPGLNATGFQNYDLAMTSKSLQLLKEISPYITRVAVIFNPNTSPSNISYLPLLHKAAADLGVALAMSQVHDINELEEAIVKAGKEAQTGCLFAHDTFTLTHYERVTVLLTQYRLPAVFAFRPFVAAGGLMSYGFDISLPEIYRIGATYIDRILRGAKPADLPVQVPTHTNFVINLKTARALGLSVPTNLLAIADDVIE
jgi:putative ABC transport system substrate-binding protein